MLPKVEELLRQFVNTKDATVRQKCVNDLLDYQGVKDTLADLSDYLDDMREAQTLLIDLHMKLSFHRQIIERDVIE